jgi:hypothetical protein
LWRYRKQVKGHAWEGDNVWSTKGFLLVPRGQGWFVSSLSQVLGEYIFFFAWYFIVVTIISHHHSVGALQLRGNHKIGTWAAIGVYGARGIRVSSGGGKCGSCRSYGGQRGA